MDQLIHDAQIHVLYTAQPTGLKLKLLNVLFKGRCIICNKNMTEGTGITENIGFILADTAADFIQKINSIFETEFSQSTIQERQKQILNFDNSENCKKLVEVINS